MVTSRVAQMERVACLSSAAQVYRHTCHAKPLPAAEWLGSSSACRMRWRMLVLALSSGGTDVTASKVASGAAGIVQPYSFLCAVVQANRGSS